MPRINLDLSALDAGAPCAAGPRRRAARARQRRSQTAQAALDAAQRAGASADAIAPLAAARSRSRARARNGADRRRELNGASTARRRTSVSERDPGTARRGARRRPADRAHAGAARNALLSRRVQPTSLRIRVYPDDLNTIEHTPAPTRGRAGRRPRLLAGALRARRDGSRAHRARSRTRSTAAAAPPGCSASRRRSTSPTGGAKARPAVPRTSKRSTRRAKETRAVLLPDRWCAIGYAAGRREVFRVWGQRIPDELLLSPDWLATANPESLLGGERAWLVDFDEALENGMALEITQQEVDAFTRSSAARRASISPRTRSNACSSSASNGRRMPQQTADELAGPSRRATRFDRASASSRSARRRTTPRASPPPTAPRKSARRRRSAERQREAPPEKDALELLTQRARLRTRAPAGRQHHQRASRRAAHGAAHDERAVARHVRSLPDGVVEPAGRREATGFLKTPTLYALRRYCVRYLRPAGALPLLRVGTQPYGILPIVGKRFVEHGLRRRDGHRQGARRPASDVGDREPQGAADERRRCRASAKDILQTGAVVADRVLSRQGRGQGDVQDPERVQRRANVGKGGVIQRAAERARRAATTGASISTTATTSCRTRRIRPAISRACRGCWPTRRIRRTKRPTSTCRSGDNNYLAQIAKALDRRARASPPASSMRTKPGPRCCRRWSPTRCRRNRAMPSSRSSCSSGVGHARRNRSRRRRCFMSKRAPQNEATFTVDDARRSSRASRIPSVTGRATLGEHVAQTLSCPSRPIAGRPRDAGRDRADRLGRTICCRRRAIWARSS